MKRKTLLALMALVMSVALWACGGKEEEVVEVATVEEIPIEVETTEEETTTEEVLLEDELPEGMYFSELTNEPIDESLKNQRPIAAMVDNDKRALPHFGLNEADIVYELMWIEELFPDYFVSINKLPFDVTDYSIEIKQNLDVWLDMRNKYQLDTITYEEYINWKLTHNFEGDI